MTKWHTDGGTERIKVDGATCDSKASACEGDGLCPMGWGMGDGGWGWCQKAPLHLCSVLSILVDIMRMVTVEATAHRQLFFFWGTQSTPHASHGSSNATTAHACELMVDSCPKLCLGTLTVVHVVFNMCVNSLKRPTPRVIYWVLKDLSFVDSFALYLLPLQS